MQFLILISLSFAALADTLISVQAIWRHGARNPYYCNWKCEEFGPEMEKLTGTGMRQLYMLGTWMKTHYVDTGFIKSTFDENEVYFESTTSNRTLMSAYSLLQGLYPQGPDVPDVDDKYLLPPVQNAPPVDIGRAALPNQIFVIPIHTKEQKDDYALSEYCPKRREIEQQNQQTQIYKDINTSEEVQQLLKNFNKEMTQQLVDITQLAEWRDTFTCTRYNGQGLPQQLSADTIKEMDRIAGLTFTLSFTTTFYQAQLFSTPFFKYLLTNFDNAIKNQKNQRFRAYSSHDTVIQAILVALNLTNAECQKQWYFGQEVTPKHCLTSYPDFASNLIFELYNSSLGNLYIKVRHNGTYVNICSGGYTCLYQTFNKTLQAQMVDYYDGCGIEQNELGIENKTPGWAIAMFIIVIIALLVASAGVFTINKKYRRAQNLVNDSV